MVSIYVAPLGAWNETNKLSMPKRRYVIEYAGVEGEAHQFLVRTPALKPLEAMRAENVVTTWLLDQASPGMHRFERTKDHVLKVGLLRPTDVVRFERRFGPITGLTVQALKAKAGSKKAAA